MSKHKRTLRWMRLDNAAKIYPAARRRSWSNVFRLSVTLTEEVDASVLQSALEVTVRRFPSMATRLRRGLFWYYLQELEHAPKILPECSYPLTPMGAEETRGCAFRVIVYHKRIAVEFFHSLTDGNGALVFLKTLTAEYLQQKYGITIPCSHGILDRHAPAGEEELEDSFLKYAGAVSAGRSERTAWHLSGTPREELALTCLQVQAKALLDKAHEYGVSVTEFLTAAMMQALLQMQEKAVPKIMRRKPIKVLVPVNLRKLFPSKTLRNFALYVTPELDPRLGQYSFAEICKTVHHFMGAQVNAKQLSRVIATNVGDEKSLAVKLLPLFIKNFVMRAVFDTVGERKSCLTLSNLGMVQLPEEMAQFVDRVDFILSPQAHAPHNCGVISYGDTVNINFIRNIEESELELSFFRALQEQGITATVQSNGG
ncbi:MAG: alcohol acetyltransferase [Oscillospiraceae bacterium]|nr:alcohol acetyltransferase [Oscillospiraceae bacterium]